MGNNQSVWPMDNIEPAPWVMLTYPPDPFYKKFSYYEDFKVYSNNSQCMNTRAVLPVPPGSSKIDFNLNESPEIKILDQNISVKDCVQKLFKMNESNNSPLTNADRIKVLYHWMTSQNVKQDIYKLTNDFNKVVYQLQKLKDKKNSFASFFALLCHYANIPCVIIKGHVKGGRYDVDKALSDDLLREWNAVLIDKKWRIVDTFWGQVYRYEQLQTPELFYLFPDPEHLKYTHRASEESWQLLQEPITIEQFTKQPILKHRFFDMKMEIVSHKSAEIRCKTGEQEIAFRLKSDTYHLQQFLCAISYQNKKREWEFEKLPGNDIQFDFIQTVTGDGNTEEETENLETLFDEDEEEDDLDITDTPDEAEVNTHPVLQTLTRGKTEIWSVNKSQREKTMYREKTLYREKSKDHQKEEAFLYVKVRFPKQGYYKVEIIGRPDEITDYDYVSIYYVSVPWVPDWPVFFPKEPITGWGPNQYLRKCGLEAVSHTKGEIKCYYPRWLQIKFKLNKEAKTKSVKLRYELTRTDDTDETEDDIMDPGCRDDIDLTDPEYRELFRPNKDGIINTKLFIQNAGEYKLCISATLNDTDKGEVIHYRIVATRDPKEVEEEHAKEALVVLENAIATEDIAVLKNALKDANPYKAHSIVTARYFHAFKLHRRLIGLRKALKRLEKVDIKSNITTIKGYPKPKQEIIAVMKALFILLGEPSKTLKHWDDIRPLLKTFGPGNVKRRMEKLDKDAVSQQVIAEARAVLGEENTFGALKQSEDVAAIMHWIESLFVMHDIDVE